VTTKTVALCVTYDEWYIWVEYNVIDLLIVVKIPSKALCNLKKPDSSRMN
jgi:hypothetical protein